MAAARLLAITDGSLGLDREHTCRVRVFILYEILTFTNVATGVSMKFLYLTELDSVLVEIMHRSACSRVIISLWFVVTSACTLKNDKFPPQYVDLILRILREMTNGVRYRHLKTLIYAYFENRSPTP
jgi:hypothetical protein